MALLKELIKPRYGITERKKAELDGLTIQVLDAQIEVQQLQAIVDSLTEKAANFAGYLTLAANNKTLAFNNRNLTDDLVQKAKELLDSSKLALGQMGQANTSTKSVASQIKAVIDQLIYSAEIINKLAVLVLRNKALNPLISDELVSLIGIAGNDANNAVAVTLVALKSAFASQSANMEAEAAAELEAEQSLHLYNLITGTYNPPVDDETRKTSLLTLINTAYDTAKSNYELADEANTRTLMQLNLASADLRKAQVKLQSLQAGLAAATAAALAS
ncbi:hypothetical protein [Mucilaginibacter celer]|nr:hypothetical protein [Mucilaginibacter celer]